MVRRLIDLGLLFLLVTSLGCGMHSETKVQPPSSATTSTAVVKENAPAEQRRQNDDASTEKTTANATSIELKEMNWNELQSLIAEQKGKLVVVDIWSTSCEPCMKEFPHLIQLQKKYPDDVVAISFDVDYIDIKNRKPSYYRERVLEFLSSQAESKLLHRMCTTSADELYAEINLDSIPAVYVYGRDGTLAKRFVGSTSQTEGVSYETQINPFIAELVK